MSQYLENLESTAFAHAHKSAHFYAIRDWIRKNWKGGDSHEIVLSGGEYYITLYREDISSKERVCIGYIKPNEKIGDKAVPWRLVNQDDEDVFRPEINNQYEGKGQFD